MVQKTSQERKEEYIQKLLEAHPIYNPDDHISRESANSLRKLSEQSLFWLYHLIPKPELAKEEEPGEEEAGRCGRCGDVIDVIYTTKNIIIGKNEDDGTWAKIETDTLQTYQCPNCCEELSVEDLDRLGVPNEIR